MEEKQILKLLQLKKEGLEELLCQQVWNKDNLKRRRKSILEEIFY